MNNPFGSTSMAAGYANFRPPVHRRIIELAHTHLQPRAKFRRALDIGCGAGISTKALEGLADHCIGIEPAEPMLQWSAELAPEADFAVGAAEQIPIGGRSIDLITAAGSLNYANLDLFFPEARRILSSTGVLIVYDFQTGRTFPDSSSLDVWFADFISRYPWPPTEARTISPQILTQLDSGFRMQGHESFRIPITLTPGFYLEYMMTETNVAFALRNGVPAEEVRSWCAETLRPVWNGVNREVIFKGYFACMIPSR
jgi:SAM-dependent methyltransferase